MAAEELRHKVVQPFSNEPKKFWLEKLFPESNGSLLESSPRIQPKQNFPSIATYRPSGAWWGRLPDDTYYCRAHDRSLEATPSTGESSSGAFSGQKLACPICGNWMFDLHLQDN